MGHRGGTRQRAVEAHGVLEVREAVRVEAPRVLRRVARGLLLVDGTRARRTHGLDEAAREARVVLLDVLLRLLLIPLGERVVEHHELVLHVRALVQLFALRDHVVDQIHHTPLRVARHTLRDDDCFHSIYFTHDASEEVLARFLVDW